MNNITDRQFTIEEAIHAAEDAYLVAYNSHCKPAELLGSLAVQSNKALFLQYIADHVPKEHRGAPFYHSYILDTSADGSVAVQASIRELLTEQLDELKDNMEGRSEIIRHSSPDGCRGIKPDGGLCHGSPGKASWYCHHHRDQEMWCLFGIDCMAQNANASICKADRERVDNDAAELSPFCQSHNLKIRSILHDIDNRIKEVREGWKLVGKAIEAFFRKCPLTVPMKQSEVPNENCMICLEPLNGICDVTKEPLKVNGIRTCRHVYHQECLAPYLTTHDDYGTFGNGKCPLCRAPIWHKGELCGPGAPKAVPVHLALGTRRYTSIEPRDGQMIEVRVVQPGRGDGTSRPGLIRDVQFDDGVTERQEHVGGDSWVRVQPGHGGVPFPLS